MISGVKILMLSEAANYCLVHKYINVTNKLNRLLRGKMII